MARLSWLLFFWVPSLLLVALEVSSDALASPLPAASSPVPSFSASASPASKPSLNGGLSKEPPEKKLFAPERWGKTSFALGGTFGSWGGIPLLGVRGVLSLSNHLAFRLNWSLMFHSGSAEPVSFSAFSLDLLVYLPSPSLNFRYYAITRLDFWPLWNLFESNPTLRKISDQPVFGMSILMGLEGILIPTLTYFLETGFSTGMVLGLSEIRERYQAFGFVIQSGLQTYF